MPTIIFSDDDRSEPGIDKATVTLLLSAPILVDLANFSPFLSTVFTKKIKETWRFIHVYNESSEELNLDLKAFILFRKVSILCWVSAEGFNSSLWVIWWKLKLFLCKRLRTYRFSNLISRVGASISGAFSLISSLHTRTPPCPSPESIQLGYSRALKESAWVFSFWLYENLCVLVSKALA